MEKCFILTVCFFEAVKRDAEFQRDAVSGRSNIGVHSVVRGLFVKHTKSGRNAGGAWRIRRPFDGQPLGNPFSTLTGKGVPKI